MYISPILKIEGVEIIEEVQRFCWRWGVELPTPPPLLSYLKFVRASTSGLLIPLALSTRGTSSLDSKYAPGGYFLPLLVPQDL